MKSRWNIALFCHGSSGARDGQWNGQSVQVRVCRSRGHISSRFDRNSLPPIGVYNSHSIWSRRRVLAVTKSTGNRPGSTRSWRQTRRKDTRQC